ncbi:MAG TPA: hypothetical protein VIU85_09160 [Chthoniobacterales bacterium]
MTRRELIFLGSAILLAAPAVYLLRRPAVPPESFLTLTSASYRLDKLYRSMEGPSSVQSDIPITDPAKLPAPDSKLRVPTVWITGLETEIVDAIEQKPISQEFFCHSNLTFSEHGATPEEFNARFGGKTHLDWRLFSLVPGRSSIELPKGFGIPVPADAALDYLTMSLNLNPRRDPVNVRMSTRLHTIAANEPGAPTKALFRRAVYVLQREGNDSTGMGPHCMAKPQVDHVGAGCGEWTRVSMPNGSTMLMPVEGMTNHWTVPPGHHVYQSEITPQLNLPFDTTIHYATIHVHPFARVMELRDLTTDKVVLKLNSRDWTDRIGVAQVDEFKSIDGVPISRGHRYQLTVDYENTSGSNTDAMAILYLYLLEKDV